MISEYDFRDYAMFLQNLPASTVTDLFCLLVLSTHVYSPEALYIVISLVREAVDTILSSSQDVFTVCVKPELSKILTPSLYHTILGLNGPV